MRDSAFADRRDAGRRLAPLIADRCAAAGIHDPVIAGIARGGVVVAAEVADALTAPLAVIVVRKIGAPGSAEVAVGALSRSQHWLDEDAIRRAGADAADVDRVERSERRELHRRLALFGDDAALLRARDVVIVDDGIAVGATATVACRQARADGAARVLLAVPVAPASWHPAAGLVDDWCALVTAHDFRAVGRFYDDFTQTSDEDVVALLARHRPADPESS